VRILVESTAVYPTKYYAEQLKDAEDARFYVERKMVVKIPQKNPNIDFPPEAIVLPSSVKMERLFEQRLEEEIPHIAVIEVPYYPMKPVIEITKDDLLRALQTDFIKELASTRLTDEEIVEIKQRLSSWIDEMVKGRALRLTKEAKVSLTNVIALIMKKVDEMIKQSEG